MAKLNIKASFRSFTDLSCTFFQSPTEGQICSVPRYPFSAIQVFWFSPHPECASFYILFLHVPQGQEFFTAAHRVPHAINIWHWNKYSWKVGKLFCKKAVTAPFPSGKRVRNNSLQPIGKSTKNERRPRSLRFSRNFSDSSIKESSWILIFPGLLNGIFTKLFK